MRTEPTISLWKVLSLSIIFTGIVYSSASAQCAAANQSLTYDSLVVGSGNDPHHFTFKQFDPSLGTLISVNISSVVSVNYGFTLTNINPAPINFSVAVGRKDNIQSEVLTTPYNNTINASIGTFLLDPNQTITETPSTVIDRFNNALNITDNIAEFMGSGSVTFHYAPRTYANNSGSPTYNYSATASDSIHFYISYNYCKNIVIRSLLGDFNVQKLSNEKVALQWAVSNEQAGRLYEIEKSDDEFNFSGVNSINSAGESVEKSYSSDYVIQKKENRILYFRLKVTAVDGSISYSGIKMVDMSFIGTKTYLYPNPSAQSINIVFNQPGCNWRADILSSNGSLVQQNYFANANTAHIDFKHRLTAAVYFIRLNNEATGQTQILNFIVK